MTSLDVMLWVLMVIYCLCAALLFLYGLNCYIMMFLFRRRRKRQKKQDDELLDRFYKSHRDSTLPNVTTQLPVFNEKYVIERLIRTVCSFDYPKNKHEIQVLDDSTDETSEVIDALVPTLRAQGYDIKHIRRKNRKGFKAGALAEGMKKAKGEFIAIFDADFVPPVDFLKKTIPFLVEDRNCGFVQTRWGHLNRDFSLLTMAQSIGIDGHFVVEQSARAWNGLFLNFNGTAGVWRKTAIEKAGGWQADTITEDLDLSYRTQLAGFHARYLFDVVVPAEIPPDINAFKSQQHRWAKGSIQTAKKILPRVLFHPGIGLFKKIQAVLHLTHYLVHPLIVLMTLLVLPLLIWGQVVFVPHVIVPLLTLMLISMVAPSSLYMFSQWMAYRHWVGKVKYIPGLMVLGMGLAVNNTKGVLEALFGNGYGQFVRTPKWGVCAKDDLGKRMHSSVLAYQIPPNSMCWWEMFLGLWAMAAFARFLVLSKFIVGPILLLHAVGFLYVGSVSLIHHWRNMRFRT